MRLVCAITFLAVILLPGSIRAVHVDLISQTAAGNPGQADSGSIRGGSEMRSASVLDDGAVFFVSLATLTPADTNFLADYYRADANGTVTAVDLPSGFATGHFFWGGTDAVGARFYLIRQFPDPSQFELRFGTPADMSSLGARSLIKAADFALGGAHAVYERDVSGFRHLFRQDLTGAAATEIQLTSGNNGDSRSPAISADGNRIVFSTTGAQIVPADANDVADVFLYEPASGAFTLISQRLGNLAIAGADSPDISANGQVICFASADHGFVSGDTNAARDVFVYQGGALQRCSMALDGTLANAGSNSPRLNASGRFVVFVSPASNLAPGVDNGLGQVFLFDREVEQLEAISLADDGAPADSHCFVPEISANGRYVTFVSKATNLASGADGAYYQIYRADRGEHYGNHPPTVHGLRLAAASGASIRFSLTSTDADQDEIGFVLVTPPVHGTLTDAEGTALSLAQAYGPARFPWHFVPADASIFTDSFTFRATDGKTASAIATVHIRMVEPDLGAVTRLSVATDGTEGARDSYLPYPGLGISADGSLVAFSSTANELDPADDDNGSADIFLRDTVSGSTRLLTGGGARDKNSYRGVLSGDGRTLAYYQEDGNGLILHDLASGVRTTMDNVSSYLSNSGPGFSHDGWRVIYEKEGRVWLFERSLGTAAMASVNTAGEMADAHCGDSAISADGQAVVFSSTATNLDAVNPGGARSVYLRRLDEGRTVLISTTPSGQLLANAIKPALSATGRYVSFLADDGMVGDGIGTLYVKDLAGGTLREIAMGAANPAISADGRFLCYTKTGANGRSQLYRADLAAVPATVNLASNASGQEGNGDSYRGVLSATGRFVAFASTADNLTPGDTNGKSDVFLNDFGMPPNELPIPSLVAITADEDTPLVDIPLTHTDAEGNDVETEVVSGPAHAALFVVHNRRPFQETMTFSYTPVAGYHGEDTFTYRCRDAEGWSPPVTVTMTIQPVNDLPRWTGMPVLWGIWPGQDFTLDLSLYVDDPEHDLLFFSLLQGAPVARLEGALLIIAADGVAEAAPLFLQIGVADRQEGPVVEFGEVLAIHVRAPMEISLTAGWNLISFPLTMQPSAPAQLQTRPAAAGAESLPFGPAWVRDAETAGYRRATTMAPGQAYWVFCPQAASLSMQVAWSGGTINPAVDMAPGWNLVGPVGFGDVSSPTWAATGSPLPGEDIWGWERTRYVHPPQNMLTGGRGYWIFSPTAQTADLELKPAE